MVYYQRPQSPHRDEDPYYNHNSNNNNNNHNNNNTYRSAPVDRDRDRDRDRDYHRSRRSSYSPARGRSPPRDAPKAPRAYHGPSSSSYRSRSDSHDRMSGRGGGNSGGGGGGGGGGYYDRDAPRDRSRSREDREWLGGPASRDVIIEGLGADVDEDYVVNPPPLERLYYYS